MKTTMLALAALTMIGCGAPAASETTTETHESALGQAQVVWFGYQEVMEGHLKAPGGVAPKAGTTVTLQLYLQQLADFMCRDYCAATTPHVFVRFTGNGAFTELPNVPKGYVPSSGGVLWDAGNEWLFKYDAPVAIPQNADRIEAYVYWDRVSYSCVLESDETCTVDGPIDGAYLSNYGKNFRIAVSP